MKKYSAVNLPIPGLPKEGNKVMNSAGNYAEILSPFDDKLEGWKLYALHLIYWEFKVPKVLGLVSPGAVWVREGDQFRKDEIEKLADTEYYIDKEGPYYIYKVKCQCGEFH